MYHINNKQMLYYSNDVPKNDRNGCEDASDEPDMAYGSTSLAS